MAWFDPETDEQREAYRQDLALIRACGISIEGFSAWDAYMFVPSIDSDPVVSKRLAASMPFPGEYPAVMPAYATLQVIKAMTDEERAALRKRLGKP